MKGDKILLFVTLGVFVLVFFIWWHTINEGNVILSSGNRELQKKFVKVPYYSDENDFDTSTKEEKKQ
ncbi:hypothetical protein [Chryseosolibacter indicus]|uniref:Uncharacterized protein n=1 Tax=Chryseosolibacter indicus TaxID=2782351 RepID=A0ABS5VN23_9BACT|nr:hypothetical protein [Chryseosolibacter indicus]MBT1702838.1 hypothetical protein [Chryseosolibacter indicus]